MKLDAWLRQDHSLPDRMLVIERLAQALNEVHDRGEPLAALQPNAIEVAGDGRCDVAGARHGTPDAAYAAPERGEGGPASPEADVYAAGAIAWEVLAGRPCGPVPTHLSEACPELPQELADAVMACLERSPQWRPRDLTYLAQLAQHARGSRGGSAAPAAASRATAARPTARATSARNARAGAGHGSGDAGSATRMRLAIGLVLALGFAGGGAYLWFGRSAEAPAATPPTTVASAPSAAGPTPATAAATSAAGLPGPALAAPSAAPAASATPASPVAIATPVSPVPTPTPAPRTSTASEPSARPPASTATAPTVVPAAPTAPAATLPTGSGEAAPAAEKAAPAPRAALTLAAVSPLSAHRPGKVLLDLRGSGMHDGVRLRVAALREPTRGISVLRQKCESDTLIRVLLDLDAQTAPGAYTLTLEDADGQQTKPLAFTVTR
jgi:eukaryotic-like serine/threonine-protein kinase